MIATDPQEHGEFRRVYVCAKCGTMASTNGEKTVEGVVERGEEKGDKYFVGTHSVGCVRMDPPCPCGHDAFNPMETVMACPDAIENYYERLRRAMESVFPAIETRTEVVAQAETTEIDLFGDESSTTGSDGDVKETLDSHWG